LTSSKASMLTSPLHVHIANIENLDKKIIAIDDVMGAGWWEKQKYAILVEACSGNEELAKELIETVKKTDKWDTRMSARMNGKEVI